MVKKTASGKVSLVQERVSWREDDAQLLEDEAMDEVQEVGLHRHEDDRMPRIIFPGPKKRTFVEFLRKRTIVFEKVAEEW